jgi:hypothetical protein
MLRTLRAAWWPNWHLKCFEYPWKAITWGRVRAEGRWINVRRFLICARDDNQALFFSHISAATPHPQLRGNAGVVVYEPFRDHQRRNTFGITVVRREHHPSFLITVSSCSVSFFVTSWS